jgi:DNA-binding MarR family transcriptional regulator
MPGYSLRECRVLVLLADRGARRPADLADDLEVPVATAGRVGVRLAQQGLVGEVPGRDDGRSVLLALTEAVQGEVNAVMEHRCKLLHDILSKVDPKCLPTVAMFLDECARAALASSFVWPPVGLVTSSRSGG